MTPAEDIERVQAHVNALIEHFDTVQIFVTRHMPAEADGTISINDGKGNWHARHGQVRDWIVGADEIIRMNARRPKE